LSYFAQFSSLIFFGHVLARAGERCAAIGAESGPYSIWLAISEDSSYWRCVSWDLVDDEKLRALPEKRQAAPFYLVGFARPMPVMI
jgi:hypothetical protein